MKTLNQWARALKKSIYPLYLVSKDTRTPIIAKVIIGVVIAYALSPIDLIPDFIPVIGFLDDIILLPIGIWFAIQLIPAHIWNECKALASKQLSHLSPNRVAAVVVITIWLLAAISFISLLWSHL